jgi:ribosomal protein S18 acetylase RimI-like enzyme
MVLIREATAADWPAAWAILEPVFRAGETYVVSPDITEDQARSYWMEIPLATFVALDDDGTFLGTYYIKPNQAGGGAHVCNCGFAVSERARGHGVASRMCEHAQSEAVKRGFSAMQFNFVVSTNETAVRLWKRCGFEVVGTLPDAFLHPRLGYVDAFVMFNRLDVQQAHRADAAS